MESGLKKFFLAFGFVLLGVGAAEACVTAMDNGYGGTNFVNNCYNRVLIKYRTSSGFEGVVGPVGPGQYEGSAIPRGEYFQYWYCNYEDWTTGRCRLP